MGLTVVATTVIQEALRRLIETMYAKDLLLSWQISVQQVIIVYSSTLKLVT